jgi:sec-independent protein translocase protein TatA
MLYLGIPGGIEIYIILGVVVLLFGAKKIPELARSMGAGINQFKKGLNDAGEETPKALDKGESARALSEEQRSSEKS